MIDPWQGAERAMLRAVPGARAYVGLGSNLGDRVGVLRSAVTALAALASTELRGASQMYETDAIGPSKEPFLNAVVELGTASEPRTLLEALLTIEREHGRTRRVRWGARTLDLDLLAYVEPDGRVAECVAPELVLPHPRMLERDFVLAPLRDVAARLRLSGQTVEAHLLALPSTARTIRAVHPSACYLPGPQADSSAG